MRLRLDKLVLSAGLALAMVATTIPVGAATKTTADKEITGWELNGTAVDITAEANKEAFASAVAGVALAEDGSITNSGISGVTGKITSITVTDAVPATLTTTAPTNTNVSNTAIAEGITLDKTLTFTDAPEVEVESKYEKAVTVTLKVGSAQDVTDNKADVAASAAATDVNTAAEGKVTDLSNAIKTAATSTNVVTNVVPTFEGTATEAAGAADTTVDVTVNCTYTVTTKYTVNEIPSGYTYDYVYEAAAATAEDTFSVFKVATVSEQSTDERITPSIVNTNEVMFPVTNFGATYYIYKGVQSATGNLLFAPTEGSDAATNVVVTSGDYTATITKADANNGADYTLAEGAPESATVAGYFNIALTKGGAAATNGPSITFKIAVPTDVTASEGKQIKWQVVRVHDYGDGNGNTVELLSATEENGYIVFSSEYFSAFALIYTEVAADTTEDTTEDETNNETESATEAGTEAGTGTTTAGSSTTSTTTSTKTADNSMMPLFMTTLLLALCAGSLAIYKEKKTN